LQLVFQNSLDRLVNDSTPTAWITLSIMVPKLELPSGQVDNL